VVAAVGLPRLLDTIPDRVAMPGGAALLAGGTLAAAALPSFWLLALWFVLELGYSRAQTPPAACCGVRLIRRTGLRSTLPSLRSHACWLVTYPLAGWAGAEIGLPATAITLAVLAGAAIAIALAVWPAHDPQELEHGHDNLPADHPHLSEAGRLRHAHAFVIDDLHPAWPTKD